MSAISIQNSPTNQPSWAQLTHKQPAKSTRKSSRGSHSQMQTSCLAEREFARTPPVHTSMHIAQARYASLYGRVHCVTPLFISFTLKHDIRSAYSCSACCSNRINLERNVCTYVWCIFIVINFVSNHVLTVITVSHYNTCCVYIKCVIAYIGTSVACLCNRSRFWGGGGGVHTYAIAPRAEEASNT